MPLNKLFLPTSSLAIYSDLHLEHSGISLCPPPDSTIVLLGDILAGGGSFSVVDWLERQPWAKGRNIIIVPGNHEYEYQDLQETLYDLKILTKPFGWHVLHDEWLEIETPEGSFRIFGSPWYPSFDGWSTHAESLSNLVSGYSLEDMANQEKALEALDRFLSGCIHDFRACKDNGNWSVFKLRERHNEAKKVLLEGLEQSFEGPTLALTHWGPTAYTTEVYSHSPKNLYFQNKDEDVLKKVNLWLHGHQHETLFYQCGNEEEKGWAATNPRGVSALLDLSSNPFFMKEGLSWSLRGGLLPNSKLKSGRWGDSGPKYSTFK